MFTSRSFILTLLGSPLLALAQSANPFKIPTNFSATAGQPLSLNWNPTTSGTVTLVLRSGASSDLAAGTVIASSIANSGSYSWTPDTMITRGSDYTVEIVSDSDPSQTNYTPYFVLDSTNTVAYSTSQVSLGAATASTALSTASATGSATSVAAAISSASASASSAASASGSSGTASGSSASGSGTTAAAAAASTSGASSAASGSQTTSGMATSSGAASGTSAASATSAKPETASTAGAAKATAMAGVLGLAALGVFAL
ncbi:hypothetical protein LTR91_007334 [Friedmanniomyces endolithicus]|uniref:Yeast cell wall synthesis Kre9/Knh1-like N-terminal domain-containing protein n=1 Tax=Friedmanniomyces endolithicus TaxID=329885 RepID=A0AAN6KR92_9PEZI|nr:hypothetical protein LTR57_012525 [Friedmanniomyces endolithicus]KAK0991283.1 hypothetical protein LTS01_008198 [Friedmanniomyces endolithicus]KAK0995435.1 hypothetical protein LTR91_007334 [Friedmanniomyces endolithicus]KAK1046699.1 hypothetical protein LTS16_005729 [Friedmanniomyces endolithicus]